MIHQNNSACEGFGTPDTCKGAIILTHWGRVTHTCVNKLIIIGSDYGLSPGRRQAIIWTNAGILLIRTIWRNFSEILNEINAFSYKKMHLEISIFFFKSVFYKSMRFRNTSELQMPRVFPMKLPSGEATWQDITDDTSILVQVMACCHKATSHYGFTWASVDPDLCRHVAALGHNELINSSWPSDTILWRQHIV